MNKFAISLLILATLPLAAQARNVARQDQTRVAAKTEVNPIAVIKHDPGMCSIFHRWGYIGDSLSSGEHEYTRKDGKTGYIDLYDYSWGQCMCRAMGRDRR